MSIAAIAAMIITVLLTSVTDHFTKLWLESFKMIPPKRRRHIEAARVMIKYIFFALFVFFIYTNVEFGKFFVLTICLISLICSFFIAKDVYEIRIKNLIRLFKRDRIQEDIDYQMRLLRSVGKDHARFEQISNRINELISEKESYS